MMTTASNRANGKIKILFLLTDLSGGGAERTLLNLLRHMNRDEFELCVGLWLRMGPLEAYIDEDDFALALQTGDPLTRWVMHRGPFPIGRLSALTQRYLRLPLAWIIGSVRVSKIILDTRPDLIVSFMPFVGVMTALWLKVFGKQRIPWIARVGNNTTQEIQYRYPYHFLQVLAHSLYQRAYQNATKIVAISQGVANDLQQHFKLSAERVNIIYNPVDSRLIRDQSLATCALEAGTFILAVGRLEYQKGFDILIRAFAAIAKTYDGQLIILGEGSQRVALESLIDRLGLATRVHLPGFVDNPWRYMSKAKCFVLPSRCEGFAHVVVGAMLYGVPVVVTDCDFGPSEIVRHGESGVVVRVGQVTALRDAMQAVLSRTLPLDRIVSQALKRAQSFDQVLITKQYEAVFKDVIAARRISPNTDPDTNKLQTEDGNNVAMPPVCVLGGHEPDYPRHLSLQQALQYACRRSQALFKMGCARHAGLRARLARL